MKTWSFIITLHLLTAQFCLAQMNLHLNSSYQNSPEIAFHNPAGIVLPERIQASVGSQLLWLGLAGSQMSATYANYNQPITNDFAVGVRGQIFTSDMFQYGDYSLMTASKWWDDRIAMGLNASLLLYAYDTEKFNLVDMDDPLLAHGSSKTAASFGIGVIVKPAWFVSVGASVNHINTPDISLNNAGFERKRVINAGITFHVAPATPQVEIQMVDNTILTQAGVRKSLLDNRIQLTSGYAGIASERQDFFIDVGVNWGQFAINYDYQYPLSELNLITFGSHRFTFSYSQGGFLKSSPRPLIELLNPQFSSTTENSVFDLESAISHENGIDRVDIVVNGAKVKSIDYPDQATLVNVREQIALADGDNILKIIAHSAQAHNTKKLHIRYEPQAVFAPVIQLPASPPPGITIESPEMGVSRTGIVTFRAHIDDAMGIREATVFQNNEAVKTLTWPNSDTSAIVQCELPLVNGMNKLKILARNKMTQAADSVVVEYQPVELAPVISVIQPQEFLTASNVIGLQCAVDNINSPDDVYIKVNGIEVVTRTATVVGQSEQGIRFQKWINLQDGANSIEIFAFNSNGQTDEKLEIFYNPLSVQTLYHETWAFIVGISNYQDAYIGNLPKAVPDAQRVTENLQTHFRFDHIISLYDSNATEARIRHILEDTFEKTQENDGILFFFAGHGETKTTDYGPIGYILPHDALRNASSTWISMDDVRRSARIAKAKHVFYVMDCCYSGLLLATRGSTNQMISTTPDFTGLSEKIKRKARDVLTAGGHGEADVDGIFVPRFIKGITGEADYDHNSYVTSREISLYMSLTVPRDADNLGWKQNPQFGKLTHEEGEFIFEPVVGEINK
ncbi:type IX secretion system membrane protein PorP/SprF [candidate division KSB1 bacterium]|nr:type IX secretion system membrane protein PorP/SprF [candidate division KSB1 bacterium]